MDLNERIRESEGEYRSAGPGQDHESPSGFVDGRIFSLDTCESWVSAANGRLEKLSQGRPVSPRFRDVESLSV